MDYTVECSDEIVLDEASATDNCGEIVIDLVEVVTSERQRHWQLHHRSHIHCDGRRWQRHHVDPDHRGSLTPRHQTS